IALPADFNPRSHEESDRDTDHEHLDTNYISIHAPMKRATLCRKGWDCSNKHFNPRSHEESDGVVIPEDVGKLYFNPRSHEESDNILKIIFPKKLDFNPRSHEESDLSFGLSHPRLL